MNMGISKVFARFMLAVALTLSLTTLAWSEQAGHGAKGDGPGAAPHWAYSGPEGPAHWGDLSPAYSACKTGRTQSPIDLSGADPVAVGGHEFHYTPSPLRIVNNGHTIQVNFGSGGYMSIGGHRYDLLQFHFHSPSEYTLAGRSFPLEVHLVHKDSGGNLAVVGVLFEQSSSANAALSALWAQMPGAVNIEKSVSTQLVDPASFLPQDRSYYHLLGSLTTPPCSEGVRWYVMKEPLGVSADQVRRFVSLVGHNARPVQPRNNRTLIDVGIAGSGR